MPIQVLMPALSPTMTEGKIARWLKQEGDKVKSGDVLAEIETDKATMEVEAVDEGSLGKILVAGGTEGVKVNTPIALILEEGEDKGALTGAAASAAPAPKATAPAAVPATATPGATPLAQRMAEQAGVNLAGVAGSGSGGKVTRNDVAAAAAGAMPAAKANGGGRVFASPLARRIAEQKGLDLSRIAGSGPNGRIVKSDVEASASSPSRTAAAPAPRAPASQPTPAAAVIAGPTPHHLVPHSTMRKVIAKRLTESKQLVPHFYLTLDCEIDTLLKGREALNAQSPKGDGAYKLSVNDFVIKATAMALKKVPTANVSWSDEGMIVYERADISVAVAIPGGLITPIVFDAANKGLIQISNEMRDLAKRARDNKLKPEEFQGGTFSISNLGMYGIKHFEAVINPPQGGILAIGAGEQRAVVKNGQVTAANVMSVTLSADHRAIDGAVGAEFIATFKKLIEEPLSMLL